MDTAQQLACLNFELEQPVSIAEQVITGERQIPLGRYNSRDVPMPNQFMHCALFSAAGTNTARSNFIVDFLPVSSGGFFYYEGPDLRQDDETVLLHLLWKLAGKVPDFPINIDPIALCREMQWTVRNKDANSARLVACLKRMQRVVLQYFDKNNCERWSTGLVWNIDFNDDRTLTVRLTSHILEAFGNHHTYINRNVWLKLPKGLPTWLFGFISSNNCEMPFNLNKLHTLSGSATREPREFKRKVRESMEKIAEQTRIQWSINHDKLIVRKK